MLALKHFSGRGGIRTHGTLLTYTHFPGVRLKPLGHPSQHCFSAPPSKKARARSGPSALHYGQGEIRTLDTLAGMPVFETGAFNHSATCPTALKPIRAMGLNQLQRSHSGLPPRFKEIREHQCALVFEQTTLYLRRVIEPGVAEEIGD